MATNYREILRLAKLGYSQRSIAASAGCYPFYPPCPLPAKIDRKKVKKTE